MRERKSEFYPGSSSPLLKTLGESGVLHRLEHQRTNLGRALGDKGASPLEGLNLVLGGSLATRDDRTCGRQKAGRRSERPFNAVKTTRRAQDLPA